MSNLAQLEQLKDSAYYIPFVMIAVAGGAFALGYRWMRSTVKDEVSEQVRGLQKQIDDLVREIAILRNGRSKASRELMFALEVLPQNKENSDGRKHLHDAIDALSSVSEH